MTDVEKGRRRKRTDGEKRLGGEKEPQEKADGKTATEKTVTEKSAEKSVQGKGDGKARRNETGSTGVTKKAGRNGAQNGKPFALKTE